MPLLPANSPQPSAPIPPSLQHGTVTPGTVTPGTVTKAAASVEQQPASKPSARPADVAGSEGPDPTRYGDWERAGRCIDF